MSDLIWLVVAIALFFLCTFLWERQWTERHKQVQKILYFIVVPFACWIGLGHFLYIFFEASKGTLTFEKTFFIHDLSGLPDYNFLTYFIPLMALLLVCTIIGNQNREELDEKDKRIERLEQELDRLKGNEWLTRPLTYLPPDKDSTEDKE